MFIVKVSGNQKNEVEIKKVLDADYKIITSKRYAFNWKLEKTKTVYKLMIKGYTDILGLMSLEYFDAEKRVEIRLLAVSSENVGSGRSFERIAGNLIAFAGRLALKEYGKYAAISLVSKTVLEQHYIDKYGFERAGKSLFMAWGKLRKLLIEYDYDK